MTAGIFLASNSTIALAENYDIEWKKCFGGSGGDSLNSVEQTKDGGYIIAGFTTSDDGNVSGNKGGTDYWIVKLKSNGDKDWQKCLGGAGYDLASLVEQTKDGGYIVAGSTNTYSNDGDVSGYHGFDYNNYWIVKLAIANSSINLSTAVYDKQLGAANNKDINVLLDLNGNTLGSINIHYQWEQLTLFLISVEEQRKV